MDLHRAGLHTDPPGDLGVGEPGTEHGEDFPFTAGEGHDPLDRHPCAVRPAVLPHTPYDVGGDAGREDHVPRGRGAHDQFEPTPRKQGTP